MNNRSSKQAISNILSFIGVSERYIRKKGFQKYIKKIVSLINRELRDEQNQKYVKSGRADKNGSLNPLDPIVKKTFKELQAVIISSNQSDSRDLKEKLRELLCKNLKELANSLEILSPDHHELREQFFCV
jgi:hypothetical protein